MFGIDLGLNVGSVTLVIKKKPVNYLVIKDDYDGKDFHDRADRLARRFADVTDKLAEEPGATRNVSIEQPLFSWGRKNPKGFAHSVELYTLVCHLLRKRGYRIFDVNAKSVKLTAGRGDLDKEGMIKAFVKRVGCLPGSKTKYGQETLADSYFIAMTGLQK